MFSRERRCDFDVFGGVGISGGQYSIKDGNWACIGNAGLKGRRRLAWDSTRRRSRRRRGGFSRLAPHAADPYRRQSAEGAFKGQLTRHAFKEATYKARQARKAAFWQYTFERSIVGNVILSCRAED